MLQDFVDKLLLTSPGFAGRTQLQHLLAGDNSLASVAGNCMLLGFGCQLPFDPQYASDQHLVLWLLAHYKKLQWLLELAAVAVVDSLQPAAGRLPGLHNMQPTVLPDFAVWSQQQLSLVQYQMQLEWHFAVAVVDNRLYKLVAE